MASHLNSTSSEPTEQDVPSPEGVLSNDHGDTQGHRPRQQIRPPAPEFDRDRDEDSSEHEIEAVLGWISQSSADSRADDRSGDPKRLDRESTSKQERPSLAAGGELSHC
jgi:hypothetical protein